jgi:LDH2 family malate/lactate/ureidoglycolate dehydrogenase
MYMLERFRVPPEEQVRIDHESLLETVTALFERVGVSHEDAVEGADTLVTSDLRGVETHGVSNMLQNYIEQYTKGTLNPRPNVRTIRESPGTATVDCDNGLVTILGPRLMRMAMDKARRVGVGVVSVFNSGHSGAIGHHAMIAAREDMVGVTYTAAGSLAVPPLGAEPRLGTNPIAVAAPARDEPFLLFDAATTAIAGNKLSLARRLGAPVAPGWIAELDGTVTTEDTAPRERGEYIHTHLGGTREQGSHKGFGFALMAEVLATMLTGDLPDMVTNMVPHGNRHCFAAYDIASFTDVDLFKDNMDSMLRMLRDTKTAPGYDRVIYPGVSEYEEERERRAEGIPLHTEVVEWFESICAELSAPRLRRAGQQ